MARMLSLWIAAAWWGSLATIGILVVPLLFRYLPSLAVAGNMAAQLFAAQTWIACVCAVVLLSLQLSMRHDHRSRAVMGLTVAGLLAAVTVQWGISPYIVARVNLAFWHKAGGVIMAVHGVCAVGVFAQLVRGVGGVPASSTSI